MTQSENKLGKLVRMARKNQEVSQNALAVRAGVCRRTVSSIENDKLNPGFAVVYKLVRNLNLPLEPLFYPERWEPKVKSEILEEFSQCTEDDLRILLFIIKGLHAARINMGQ